MKRWAVGLILVLAFLGIANSAYLAQQEATSAPLLCNLGESLSGCNAVAASEYSRLFGISLANFGLLFYTILFVLAAFELVLYNQLLRKVLQVFSVVGFCFSLYSTYVQIFIIDALCIYCLASAFITLLVLILASSIEPLRAKRAQPAASTDAV